MSTNNAHTSDDPLGFSLPPQPAGESGGLSAEADRRTTTRYACDATVWAAPYWGREMPPQSAYEEVRCFSISSQGIALLWPRSPEFESLAIRLAASGEIILVTAKVAYWHPDNESPGLYRIGCCFLSRE